MNEEIQLLNALIDGFEKISKATLRHNPESAKEYQDKAEILKGIKSKM